MTVEYVREWMAEIRESQPRYAPVSPNARIADFYRAVLKNIAENPRNPSATRAVAETALEI